MPLSWCPVPSCLVLSYPSLSCLLCLALACLLSHAVPGSALCCWWLCAGGSVCCLLCGGLRDEDQYLLRHSSPALDHDSPCGQHMLLAHLEHQDKEQLQRTLARLENENRSVARKKTKHVLGHGAPSLELGTFPCFSGWWTPYSLFSYTINPFELYWKHNKINQLHHICKTCCFCKHGRLC